MDTRLQFQEAASISKLCNTPRSRMLRDSLCRNTSILIASQTKVEVNTCFSN